MSSEKFMAFSPSSLSEDGDGAKREDKVCRVCGDRAIGYNFGIVACESCKSFFRRQASRSATLKCPFHGNCEINVNSRRFCQACRLKKCFLMGMSTELLKRCEKEASTSQSKKRSKLTVNEMEEVVNDDSSDEVTVSKEFLQELIRQTKTGKKLNECICQCKCGFYPKETKLTAKQNFQDQSFPNSPVHFPASPKMDTSSFKTIPSLRTPPQSLYLPGNFPQPINLNWYNPGLTAAGFTQMQATSIPNPMVPTAINYMKQSSSQRLLQPSPTSALSDALASFTTSPSTSKASLEDSADSIMKTLPKEEQELLQELVKANECLKAPLEVEAEKELSLMEVVNITNLALRRIIVMAKELGAFKSLRNQDQINLIKGGASELLIIRGVMVFDPSRNAWNHQTNQGSLEMQVKLDILLRSPIAQQHYEEHKKFLESFGERIRRNEAVMLCVAALVLFSPDRPLLTDPQRVAAIQHMYTQLLLRVLESVFANSYEARSTFDSLLLKLMELRKINEGLLSIYCRLDPNQLDPLLLELFDLKAMP